MTKLDRGLPRRPALEESLAAEPKGDLDLLPVAAIWWAGSVARVAAAALEDEVFQGEATLALFCALFIPCWSLWSWIQCKKGTDHADARGGDDRSVIFTKS